MRDRNSTDRHMANRLTIPVTALCLIGVVSLGVACRLALTREERASISVTVLIVPNGRGVLYANGRLVGPVPGDYCLHAFEDWLDKVSARRNDELSDARLIDTGIGEARLVTKAMADSGSEPWILYQRGDVSGSVRLSVHDSQGRRTRMSLVTHATFPSGLGTLIVSFSVDERSRQ